MNECLKKKIEMRYLKMKYFNFFKNMLFYTFSEEICYWLSEK